MKKIIFLLTGVLSIGLSHAQVGINTTNPQATLDIISSGNSSATQALSAKNSSDREILSLQDNGYLGLGVPSPGIRLDLRDGFNNSIIGIGTSSQTAAEAQAGAIKYDPGSQSLYLSDGTVWKKLSAHVIRTYVIGDINSGTQSFANNASTVIQNWREQEDLLGSFNPTTGVFTAPRDGTYTMAVIATFSSSPVSANSFMQLELVSPSAIVKSQSSYYGAGTFQASVLCSGSFNLLSGQTLQAVLTHTLGGTKNLRTGYCNLSILEN